MFYAALLTVNDDEFWEDVSPVKFGELPALQDAVTVVGYPIGGDTICVTRGVVSRMKILSYVRGWTKLTCLQVMDIRIVVNFCIALSLLISFSFNDAIVGRCCHKLWKCWWSSLQ